MSALDTTQPFWYATYLHEDQSKSRFDQVINGIFVGPTANHYGGPSCSVGEAKAADGAEANGTVLEIIYRDDAGQLQRDDAIQCRGVVVAHEVEYYFEPEANLDSKLRTGQLRWEDAAHGGTLAIYRQFAESPGWTSGIAADRWYPSSIDGRPAAIAKALHEIGLGPSAIVIWDPDSGVQTTLVATNFELDQLIAIAERLN